MIESQIEKPVADWPVLDALPTHSVLSHADNPQLRARIHMTAEQLKQAAHRLTKRRFSPSDQDSLDAAMVAASYLEMIGRNDD